MYLADVASSSKADVAPIVTCTTKLDNLLHWRIKKIDPCRWNVRFIIGGLTRGDPRTQFFTARKNQKEMHHDQRFIGRAPVSCSYGAPVRRFGTVWHNGPACQRARTGSNKADG